MIEKVITFEGKEYLILKKATPEGSLYSFDGKETWHDTMVGAYTHALETSKLVRVGDVKENSDDFESFVVQFVRELQDLEDGESLKVVKYSDKLVVFREKAVMVTRASVVREVDLRVQKGGGE